MADLQIQANAPVQLRGMAMADAINSTVVLLDRQVVIVEGRIYHGDGVSTIAQLVASGVFNPRNNEGVAFPDITGNPYDNASLKDALDAKANSGQFDPQGAAATAINAHVSSSNPHPQYLPVSQLGAPNGAASLDATGKITATQLPPSSTAAFEDLVGVPADNAALQAALDLKADVAALGTAAGADTTDFDPAGAGTTAATAAITAHNAEPDPHGAKAYTDTKSAALQSQVDAAVALIDGSMKAPEYFLAAGTYPTTYSGGAIPAGASYRLGAGTLGTRTVDNEDLLVALVDTPGQVEANWQVLESNRVTVSQTVIENSATTDNTSLVTPIRWWQGWTKGLTLSAFLAAVRNTVLTGLSTATATDVTASDSILVAIGKFQARITSMLAAIAINNAKVSNATHTGDVTGDVELTIGPKKVTNAHMASMPGYTIKGNYLSGLTAPRDLTVAQVRPLLQIDNVDNTSDLNKPVSTAQATAISDATATEVANRNSAISSAIATEVTDRNSAISSAIATEVSGRNSAISAAIATEVVNRDSAIVAATAGLADDRGTYDASSNLFPETGGSGVAGAVLRADYWTISVAGVLNSLPVNIGDVIRSLADGPGQNPAYWHVDAAIAVAATGETVATTTDNVSYMTPVRTFQAIPAAVFPAIVFTDKTAVTSLDTLTAALGKLQAQLDAINPFFGGMWGLFMINQTGTSAPTIIGVDGPMATLSPAVTLARTSTGLYTLTGPTGTFLANKTRVICSNGYDAPSGIVRGSRSTGAVVTISSKTLADAFADDMLKDCTVLIIVKT